MSFRLLSSLSLVLLGAALVGCGGSEYEGPRRFPLSGEVTFQGKPVDGGMISFLPAGTDARPSGGPIVGGKYSVPEERGANEGAYRVEIRWPQPTGQKRKDPDTGEMVDVQNETIPPRYNTNSELQAQVAEGQTEFNFDLK